MSFSKRFQTQPYIELLNSKLKIPLEIIDKEEYES